MAGSGNQRYLYWAVSWENKWQNTKTNFHGFVYLIRWFLNRYSYWGERQKFCVPFLERYVNAMIVRMPPHGITLPRGRTGHIWLFLGQRVLNAESYKWVMLWRNIISWVTPITPLLRMELQNLLKLYGLTWVCDLFSVYFSCLLPIHSNYAYSIGIKL